MEKRFDVIFLEEAFAFLAALNKKHYQKILYNIRLAQVQADADLFKKVAEDIWEFRTLYQGLQYRLLAFWDKTDNSNTLVIATHGFVKKRSKIAENELLKATQQKTKYFRDKELQKKKTR